MSKPSLRKTERDFVTTVWDFYRQYGRHHLPWRQTNDPYRILVSELMLQQTQVERVIPKYEAFLERWPTVQRLAAASLAEVLVVWQGLGYNRRAKYLHTCAQIVWTEQNGHFPSHVAGLRSLPGVGPYTAGAIAAFAYGEPVTLIETNVRRVFLHHFFPAATEVPDTALLPLIAKTVPRDQAKNWYAALMDYGSYLKRAHPNANVRSKHYTKQSKFAGSDRQIRGAILRSLTGRTPVRVRTIAKELSDFDPERVYQQLSRLEDEGMVRRVRGCYRLG